MIRRARLAREAEHVAEPRRGKGEFPKVAEWVHAHPVHHLSESDYGVSVGESERATGTGCSERDALGPEHPFRLRRNASAAAMKRTAGYAADLLCAAHQRPCRRWQSAISSGSLPR